MTYTRFINGATALSEFQGYNGDCGECAENAVLHVVLGVPFDKAYLNAIVVRDISRGLASANGAEPLQSIHLDLLALNVPHQLFDYPGPSNWEQIVLDNIGISPLIMELANGQALPTDEHGLHYHFIALFNLFDNGDIEYADGDSTNARNGLLSRTNMTTIQASQPCGIIVVKMPERITPMYNRNSDGSLSASNGVVIPAAQTGFIDYILTASNNVVELPIIPPFYPSAGHAVLPLTNGRILSWDSTSNRVVDNQGGEILVNIYQSYLSKLTIQSMDTHAIHGMLSDIQHALNVVSADVNTISSKIPQ